MSGVGSPLSKIEPGTGRGSIDCHNWREDVNGNSEAIYKILQEFEASYVQRLKQTPTTKRGNV